MSIVPRRSYERGGGDHGWLKAFHTFNVGAFTDGKHDGFGCIRVMNEDRFDAGTGFGLHPHREFEIFTYIISGQILHEDSMSNREFLKRGDIQLTSAGTGIRHSEKSHGSEQGHIFQIWSIPSKSGLTPQYYTRHFEEEEKRDKWCLVVAPADAPGVTEAREASSTPAPVHSPLSLHAAVMSPSKSLPHTFPAAGRDPVRKVYLQIAQTSGYNPSKERRGAHIKVSVGDVSEELWEGDGAYIIGEPGKELVVENVSELTAEVLLFDVE
ncbi:RmlC-like cupin domain-containing protein [Fomitopsis serialis]|uniref:RmlC-like cupin domain-containing protein n=1 Tax=Fomitopsis serialis TaxID=139415 RepID=UPI002007730E|nr:RmlC-like cupin domain-containing protein [Neoantrodia serialis]KAH9933453.1 RmlC-like cupin domain-containing protein [Neoantrodia serialis]